MFGEGAEAGDGLGRQPAERAVLPAGQGLPDRVGGGAAGGGELDEHRSAVAGAGAAGDVSPSLQPVQDAGQRRRPRTRGGAEFGDHAGAAVGEIGQSVDLGGRQVEVDKLRVPGRRPPDCQWWLGWWWTWTS